MATFDSPSNPSLSSQVAKERPDRQPVAAVETDRKAPKKKKSLMKKKLILNDLGLESLPEGHLVRRCALGARWPVIGLKLVLKWIEK